MDGEYLSHLSFADDIPHELQHMLRGLAEESESGSEDEQVEHKGDDGNYTPIYVNKTQIENVESYIQLGQRYSTRDKHQDNEIQ